MLKNLRILRWARCQKRDQSASRVFVSIWGGLTCQSLGEGGDNCLFASRDNHYVDPGDWQITSAVHMKKRSPFWPFRVKR